MELRGTLPALAAASLLPLACVVQEPGQDEFGDDATSGEQQGDDDADDNDDGEVRGAACEGPVAPMGSVDLGSQASHWAGFTTAGEDWDYCELEGTPFLLILSAGWCTPCNQLAAGLSGQPTTWEADLDPIRAGLEAGSLAVVEVLVDNFLDYGATSMTDLQQWEMIYPNDEVHLIGDDTPGTSGDEPLWKYLYPIHMGSTPAGILVDAEFNIEALGVDAAIERASSQYGG